MKPTKEKMVRILKSGKIELWNRYKELINYRVNLCHTDLRGANLSDADLSGADLRDADLQGADLQGADLRRADLRDTDFQDADLRDVNFQDADLRRANLCASNLRIYQSGKYVAYIQKTNTRIGCEYHANEFWLNSDISDISEMADDSEEWWLENGEVIKAIIRQMQKN